MDKYLIEHCCPTLAGLKSSSIFTFSYESRQLLQQQIAYYNKMFSQKGIRLRILRRSDSHALIIVYRETLLERDFRKEGVADFMAKYGYSVDDLRAESAITRLSERFESCGEFPHEIGVFLGYPLDDVIGFIENNGRNCKCCGCWKVYENECEAMKKFEQYRKCNRIYKELWHGGRSILKLTVAA